MSRKPLLNPDSINDKSINIYGNTANIKQVVSETIIIENGGSIEVDDLKLENLETKNATIEEKLEVITTNGNINYTTPDIGQPNFSLHTDGSGNTFWSPDDTGSPGITFNGSLPVNLGQHLLFSSTDANLVGKSVIEENISTLNVNGLDISNANEINTSSLIVNGNNVETQITDLQNNKVPIDGSIDMTGELTTPNIRTTSTNVHIGVDSGLTNQSISATSCGAFCGQDNQGDLTSAYGALCAQFSQGNNSSAYGGNCATNSQGNNSCAFGVNCAINSQSNNSCAYGYDCGKDNQGFESCAYGYECAATSQGVNCCAYGYNSCRESQGDESCAYGQNSGTNQLANGACAFGSNSAFRNSTPNSVYIGAFSGVDADNKNNCVVINSTGTALNPTNDNQMLISAGTNVLTFDNNGLDVDNKKIINCSTPVNPTDVANKQYIDDEIEPIQEKTKYITVDDGPIISPNRMNINELLYIGDSASIGEKLRIDNSEIRSNNLKFVTNPGATAELEILSENIIINPLSSLSFSNQVLSDCSDPIQPQDVATKNYIDTINYVCDTLQFSGTENNIFNTDQYFILDGDTSGSTNNTPNIDNQFISGFSGSITNISWIKSVTPASSVEIIINTNITGSNIVSLTGQFGNIDITPIPFNKGDAIGLTFNNAGGVCGIARYWLTLVSDLGTGIAFASLSSNIMNFSEPVNETNIRLNQLENIINTLTE